MNSRRHFIKTSAIAGSVGLSGICSPVIAKLYDSATDARTRKRSANIKPVGHFSGVSLDNLRDTPLLTKDHIPGSPVLERFRNTHPRIFFTASDLATFKKSLNDEEVRRYYSPAGILGMKPPAFNPNGRNGGLYRNLGSYAISYLLEPDTGKLEPILEWLEMATTYPHCGVDLDAEYFMEGVGLTYDWLYEFIPSDLRDKLRDTIVRQCREVYEASLANRTVAGNSYQQNHFWYAHLSLAFGAAAIYGEVPEAEDWLIWAWDRFERIALSFSPDGTFHEGPGYWDYSMPALYMYTDLYELLSGVHVDYMDAGFRGQAEFRFHHLYPGLELTTALEDTSIRKGKPDIQPFLWESRRFRDPVTKGMAKLLNPGPGWLCWNLLWLDPNLKSRNPLKVLPTGRHFHDVGTVFARTGWDKDATFIAFVSRPFGGHTLAELFTRYRIGGTGHNHPEQNHFIVFGRGEVLAADPGYTYEKMTRNHNTVLINGKGQYGDGEMWPRPNPGRAHITEFTSEGDISIVTGDATSAYPEELGLSLFERTLVLAGRDLVLVYDRLYSKNPVNYSWLIHHYGNLSATNDRTWVITKNESRLLIHIVKPTNFDSKAGTYRPQYIHPERNLTPSSDADINLLEIITEPVREVTFLTPLLIGNIEDQHPEIKNFSGSGCEGVIMGDLIAAFRTNNDVMTIPLPWGGTRRTNAKTMVARKKGGRVQMVLSTGIK